MKGRLPVWPANTAVAVGMVLALSWNFIPILIFL
jgi:hypothetical protein